jgi:hypothetical protein
MDLQHGCRAAFGPLELRIQPTAGSNGFTVYVDDPRRKPSGVYEQRIQATLESTKDYLVLRAREYLESYQETAEQEAKWRCS